MWEGGQSHSLPSDSDQTHDLAILGVRLHRLRGADSTGLEESKVVGGIDAWEKVVDVEHQAASFPDSAITTSRTKWMQMPFCVLFRMGVGPRSKIRDCMVCLSFHSGRSEAFVDHI